MQDHYGEFYLNTHIPAPDHRLDYLLNQIIQAGFCDAAYLYRLSPEASALVAYQSAEEAPPEGAEAFTQWAQNQLQFLSTADSARVYLAGDLPPVLLWSMQRALIQPLHSQATLIGALVLLSSHPAAFDALSQSELASPIALIQTVLENITLSERLITTAAIATTAQAIARNPSPQNIVHALRDHLFNPHILGCAIVLFGPTPPQKPKGPFDYMEIVGSWSRLLGSQVGVGLRMEVSTYQDILTRLENEKTLIIDNLMKYLPPQVDDFIQVIIETSEIQTLALVLLESERGQLGLLGIFTDKPYEFSTQELRAYQIVGEFLTMSTLANVLQQQADFVQQGRAALLDAVTDSVIMALPDDHASVLTVNEHFTGMFGLKAHEVHGISLYTLLEKMRIPASVRRELQAQWQNRSQAPEGKLRGEFSMTSMAGTHSDIQWYSAPVYQDGQILGYIYTFHDITPERTAERLRSELLSRISHELRTPLTSIQGFSAFILEAHDDNLPELAREYTQIIHQSASHLNHVFNSMIEISRANAGELKLHFSEADLGHIVSEAVQRVQGQANDRQQQIITQIEAPPILMRLDVERIHQVLMNLMTNAIRYAPPGSRITLATHYIQTPDELPASAPPDVIIPCGLISVVDEGEGVEKDEVEKVFLPFYRTRIALKNKSTGAGLGLAITRSIMELHRGHIWAEPAQRKSPGGRFYFTIPMLDQN